MSIILEKQQKDKKNQILNIFSPETLIEFYPQINGN